MFRCQAFLLPTLALWSLSGSVSGCVSACEREAPPTPREEVAPAPPASIAAALGVDAASLTHAADPPAPAGDFAADVAGFSTLEACVTQHASLDPLVGDALRSLGYETFLRDTCRILQAAQARSPAPCAPIDASSLRARCEAIVAMATKSADACPAQTPGELELGREPVCVAVASRDPRLCAAEERPRRPACEALTARDEAKCAALPVAAERAECARAVRRFASSLEAPASLPALAMVRGTLELAGVDGTPDPAKARIDLASDVERGVVVVVSGGRTRAVVGALHESGARWIAPPPGSAPRLALAVVVGTGAAEARVDRLELDVPGRAALEVPGVRSDVHVSVKELEPQRAGSFELDVQGVVGVPPQAFKVKASYVSFVRDVVRIGAE